MPARAKPWGWIRVQVESKGLFFSAKGQDLFLVPEKGHGGLRAFPRRPKRQSKQPCSQNKQYVTRRAKSAEGLSSERFATTSQVWSKPGDCVRTSSNEFGTKFYW